MIANFVGFGSAAAYPRRPTSFSSGQMFGSPYASIRWPRAKGASRNESTLADPHATDDMFDRRPLGWSAAQCRIPPAPAQRLLVDGDVIDLGHRHFEAIHTQAVPPRHRPVRAADGHL